MSERSYHGATSHSLAGSDATVFWAVSDQKKIFYLMMHSHILLMVLSHWTHNKDPSDKRKISHWAILDYLAVRNVSTNHMHHPRDMVVHTMVFYYTSRGALAGMRNSSIGSTMRDRSNVPFLL